MLKIEDQEHYNKVIEFADRVGLCEQLGDKIKYLDEYAENGNRGHTECYLYKDFAPYSFEFVMMKRDDNGEYHRWFNGGLIYHGPHDGGGDGSYPTLSVCVSPTNGWSIHT